MNQWQNKFDDIRQKEEWITRLHPGPIREEIQMEVAELKAYFELNYNLDYDELKLVIEREGTIDVVLRDEGPDP